jgi:hypothetical protein
VDQVAEGGGKMAQKSGVFVSSTVFIAASSFSSEEEAEGVADLVSNYGGLVAARVHKMVRCWFSGGKGGWRLIEMADFISRCR